MEWIYGCCLKSKSEFKNLWLFKIYVKLLMPVQIKRFFKYFGCGGVRLDYVMSFINLLLAK